MTAPVALRFHSTASQGGSEIRQPVLNRNLQDWYRTHQPQRPERHRANNDQIHAERMIFPHLLCASPVSVGISSVPRLRGSI